MYLLPKSRIFRVPDDLPDHVAVLTEIMSVTHGVETAQSLMSLIGGHRFAQSVAVLGVGIITTTTLAGVGGGTGSIGAGLRIGAFASLLL